MFFHGRFISFPDRRCRRFGRRLSVRVTAACHSMPRHSCCRGYLDNSEPRTAFPFGSVRLRFYRSTDTTITMSYRVIVLFAFPSAIAPAGTLSTVDAYVAPETTGTCNYGACVLAVPDESDTANNCSSAVQVDVE